VIMPSYTFVFSANSFVLRGAVLFYWYPSRYFEHGLNPHRGRFRI
jgi:hypothetical protein